MPARTVEGRVGRESHQPLNEATGCDDGCQVGEPDPSPLFAEPGLTGERHRRSRGLLNTGLTRFDRCLGTARLPSHRRRQGSRGAHQDGFPRSASCCLELILGGAKKDLSAAQAKALVVTVRPRDIAARHVVQWPPN